MNLALEVGGAKEHYLCALSCNMAGPFQISTGLV